jgi:DNA-directed RNA polymerase subunit RPC12/RpoP
MPTTGEKPGKGVYKCNTCGEIIRLDDNTDTLPPCPRCNGTSWTKIG